MFSFVAISPPSNFSSSALGGARLTSPQNFYCY
jgi:hypothetical protein